MEWKTWQRFTAVVLFLITVGTFYFTYLDTGEPDVIIQTFPSATELDSLDNSEDITFSFFLYNQGEQAAVIDRVLVTLTDGAGEEAGLIVTINPEADFSLDAGINAKEIEVTLAAPGEDAQFSLQAEVYTGDTKLVSDTIPVLWGSFLE